VRLMQIKHWNDSKKVFAALPSDTHIWLC
jgi:hypothetical protein